MAVSVALANDDGLVGRFDAPRSRRHAETILPAITALLDITGSKRTDISHLCVDVGPGMFTGLRVGVTTAITLAYALDVPVISVSSLEILAWRLALDSVFTGRVGAVLDARRKECFVEIYDIADGGASAVSSALACAPANAASLLRSAECVAVTGDGAQAYPDAFAGFALIAPAPPDAATAAVLATQRIDRATSPDAVAPRYLREPDAEIPKDLR